jgi:hypothetical protein
MAVSTEKWAYYPATIQWGWCPEVNRVLLVGYSPRSRTGDDNDIPEEQARGGTGLSAYGMERLESGGDYLAVPVLTSSKLRGTLHSLT